VSDLMGIDGLGRMPTGATVAAMATG